MLYGRCDPDSLTPFQPFSEALSTFVHDTGGSRQLLGGSPSTSSGCCGASSPSGRPPAASGDQEGERYELFEAVADWLALISTRTPCCWSSTT